MNKYDTMLTFYAQLGDFLDSNKFHKHDAEYLIGLFEEFNEDKKRQLDLKKLRETYKVKQEEDLFPEDLVKWAFQDMAPYLRDPKARLIAKTFIERAGMDDVCDLFVHIQNVRFPNEEDLKYGPAVITLVVNRFDVFQRWLQDPAECPIDHVHASFSDKKELLEGNESVSAP